MSNKVSFDDLDSFIDSHKVFYIRHKFDSTEPIYETLISEGIIAVHYGGELKPNIDPTDPKNRENPENFEDVPRRVLERFKKCCSEGAIVFADYSDPEFSNVERKANIGIIPEGTDYEVKSYSGHKKYPKGLIYEQAKLHHHRTFSYVNVEPFLAIHPRGGTLVRWKQGEKIVKFVYRKELGLLSDPRNITFEVLLPAQQEVLCSEFLRIKAPKELRLSYFLLPVGRGMKTIDIDGANEKVHLMAQVSFTTNKKEILTKIAEMENLAQRYKAQKKLVQVYFGPDRIRHIAARTHSNVQFISFEHVFNEMKDTGILGDMLKIRIIS